MQRVLVDVPAAAGVVTSGRFFRLADCCGSWIQTADGTVWAPGDSQLIPEHHLGMPAPDALLSDFSDTEWHFGSTEPLGRSTPTGPPRSCCTTGAASTPPTSRPPNGDPACLVGRVHDPDGIRVLAPGEPFVLHRLDET